MRIEEAISRLVGAYRAAGGTTAAFDPATEEELDELRHLVEPFRVPRDIEVLWATFQELGVPGIIDTHPLGRVETAIGARGHTFLSRVLLSIGGSGPTRCYLELADASGAEGGAVWTLDMETAQLHEAAPSLPALLDATAMAWERGIVRLSEAHPFPWAAWDEEAWARLKAEVLPVGRVAGAWPRGWLPRWLAAEGLSAADVTPRGPSSTIAALLEARADWRTTQTVRGRIRSLVAAETAGAEIDDGTGRLTVYVPREVNPFALLRFDHDIELDVRRFPADTEVEPPFDGNAFDALAVAVREVDG